ncbi:hypothetical protein GCM10028796_32670 [Ramlibacter monticola]|uniref:Uncharacterized protein n=1 Tax=Ramlibacter monticola TaxID=1926872 RepID=A0A936Z613_9BURK|nr:hypothetical protein [Ramlibacter monticola]MBL0394162.1 hypothetical protein [Ramlibacter monticola]
MTTPAQAAGAQLTQQRPTNPNTTCQQKTKLAPTTRARDKEAITLAWLGIFACSTTPQIKKLLAIKADGYLPKLQHDGLVEGRTVGKMNEKIWTLTPRGRESAAQILGWHPYKIRAERVNVSIASHNGKAQDIALDWILTRKGPRVEEIRKLTAYLDMQRTLSVAAPDVVYASEGRYGGVVWLAWEIECNPKADKELTNKVKRLAELQVRHGYCDRLHVEWHIRGGETVLRRYERVWEEACRALRAEMIKDAYPNEPEMKRIKAMAFPTCKTHHLPD